MAGLMLFLDAFRHSYLTEKNTPFIYSLAENGISTNLNTLPGYHVEYSILSGAYPTKHNVWAWFYLNQEKAPFRWVKAMQPLFSPIDKTGFKKYLRNFITYYTCFMRYASGKTRLLKINELPLDKVHLFDITVDRSYVDKDSLNVPTLFDVLRQNNKKYIASEWPVIGTHEKTYVKTSGSSDREKFEFLKNTINKDYDFRFCHFWNLDSLMHMYGINHPKVKEHLRALDNWVEELVTSLRKKEPTLVSIFSDHGMVEVQNTVNVIKHLKSSGIPEKDYIIFPDSTMTRIWLKNQGQKQNLVSALQELKSGKIYDKQNIHELHIPYVREYVGDILFMVNPGLQISPNFFQAGEVAKAMHGYSIHNPELDGIFIMNGPGINASKYKDAKLVDVCPSTLNAIGITPPSSCDGRIIQNYS